VDETSADSGNFIGGNRCANAAVAERDATFDLTRGNGSGKWDYEVGKSSFGCKVNAPKSTAS
jgi:hypothetical protein